jgi:hypothetical protein
MREKREGKRLGQQGEELGRRGRGSREVRFFFSVFI